MNDHPVDLAEGKLTSIAIDFDNPDWCEFRVDGHGGRFRVPRRMIRGVNSSSVVVVAYRPDAIEPAEVAGMIVHRCGRSASLQDREVLRTAVTRRISPNAARSMN